MGINRWSKAHWFIGVMLLILLIAGLSTLFPLQGYGQGGLAGITGTPYYLPYVERGFTATPTPTITPTPTATPSPTATPEPTGVFVRNNYLLHNGRHTPEADPALNDHLLGEVINNTGETIRAIYIEASFLDEAGNLLWGLTSQTRNVGFTPLGPGEKMCFYLNPGFGIVAKDWAEVSFFVNYYDDVVPHPEIDHRIVEVFGDYPGATTAVEYEFTNNYHQAFPEYYFPARVIHYDPVTGQILRCRSIYFYNLDSTDGWPSGHSERFRFGFTENTNPYDPNHVYIQKPGYIQTLYTVPDFP